MRVVKVSRIRKKNNNEGDRILARDANRGGGEDVVSFWSSGCSGGDGGVGYYKAAMYRITGKKLRGEGQG